MAEQLARFRGRPFRPEMLVRRDSTLALVKYALDTSRSIIDLDDPETLGGNALRPSQIATRHRHVTRQTARTLFHDHPNTVGLRWWSTIEASRINVTLFAERAQDHLTVATPTLLSMETPELQGACASLGLVAEKPGSSGKPGSGVVGVMRVVAAAGFVC